MNPDQIIQLLKVLIVPAVVVFVIYLFREPLKNLIGRSTNLRVKIPGDGEVEITAEQTKSIVEQMLKEVDNLIEDMTPEQCNEFLKFAAAGSAIQLADDFIRESDFHNKVLRPLRRRHLIRPTESGRWQSKKHIEITPFGRLVLNVRREEIKKEASKSSTR